MTVAAPHPPDLRIVAGRLSDDELTAVVSVIAAVAARGWAGPAGPGPQAPAWRRAALVEQAGACHAASPRDLDGACRR